MKLFYFGTLFLLIGSPTLGWTQHLSARQVSQVYYRAECDKVRGTQCRRPGITAEKVPYSLLQRIPGGLRTKLQQLAYDQAQIWGDTILEGDFAADGNVQLDTVVIIRAQNRVIGYGIRYSERAWYIGDCLYNFKDPESLRTCREGRIVESSFVSTDLQEAEVDENQFADFVTRD